MTNMPQNIKVFLGVVAGCVLAVGISQLVTGDQAHVPEIDNSSAETSETIANSADPASKRVTVALRQDQKASKSDALPVTVGLQAAIGPRPRYLAAKWDEIHFKPAIDEATNAQCLTCHKEIVTHKVRTNTPAGLKSSEAMAWYQTLDTYSGSQVTFHDRHLTSSFAKKVMNLKCNFCHQGHDPREEASRSSATTVALGDFKMRKTVNPEKSCLMCHGKFPAASMELEGSWAELRQDFEDEETRNGCLTCHGESFRTVRHQVNYLNAKAIEQLAAKGTSDVCLGCHGGRAWYRTGYPYPRHPWPDMPEETPAWAKDRPTESAPEHRIEVK